MKQTATASVMRSVNRSAVLNMLRQHSPISPTELADRLQMSLPTVTRIVDELMAEDLVRVKGMTASTGGRPRRLLELNGQAYAVVGVDLGGTKILGTVADLDGHVQHEIYSLHREAGPSQMFERLCELIEQLLAAPRPDGQRVRGIGIGAPGFVRNPEGLVAWAPSLDWREVPLKQMLAERFNLPVFVENDVNLAALGELGFGGGRGVQNLVCLAIGTGIGAGVVIDGAVYAGSHQSAGEIGYLPPGIQFLGHRRNGSAPSGFGPLESLASGSGIAERARRVLAEHGADSAPDAEQVFQAARRGERWAQQVVDETVDYLSLAVASICTLLDPEVVILGGGVSRSADLLIAPIMRRLEGVIPQIPPLVASPLDRRGAVMGAIMLVLQGTTDYTALTRVS